MAICNQMSSRRVAMAAALSVCAWLLGNPGRLAAQHMDSFEGGQPRWRLVESDCRAQLTEHEISLIMPHGGRTCELVEVACGTGQTALLAYVIEPCAILDEFQPSLWTRCSSSGLRLGVRVVFPEDRHPVTGGRLTTILWGDSYSESGQWQELQTSSMQRRLNEETVAIRQRLGSQLKLENAYADALVLNVYTGPGRYRLQMDDLNLKGIIPLAAIGQPLPANWRQQWQWRQAVPSADERFWAGPNRVPVWLQHQGESPAWIRSLGFTGVMLRRLPSPSELQQIHDANLAAISPPPTTNVAFDEAVAPTIKGWLIGEALDGQQTEVARQQSRAAARLAPSLQRPLIGEALEQYWSYSRIADEVIVPLPDSNSAGSWQSKLDWLAGKLSIVRQRNQGWVSIPLGQNPAANLQYQSAMQVVHPEQPLPRSLTDPFAVRHQVAGAVVAGARGVVMRGEVPLSRETPDDKARLAALRLANHDLHLWGPWLVAGEMRQPPELDRPDFRAAAWSVSDSHLVIATVEGTGSQFVVPPTAVEPLQVRLASNSGAFQVLRLTEGRLQAIPAELAAGKLTWSVDRPAPLETFVVTANPLVMDYLRRETGRNAESNAADLLECVSHNLQTAQRLVNARFRLSMNNGAAAAITPQHQQLALAERQLAQGWQALRSSQAAGATSLAWAASNGIQAVMYDAQRTAISNLAVPQSSPFVLSPLTLHMHWELADACARSTWRDVPLPGGDFSNLTSMLQSGWTQKLRLKERVESRVELIDATAKVTESNGLRLAAYRTDAPEEVAAAPVEGGYEGASLLVRSAAAKVEPGQLVRVSATAHVLRGNLSTDSGLLVYDNQAGPSLGQLVRGETGDRVAIELYRFVVSGDEFRLLAECRGECDIVLEGLRLSVITPAHNRESFITTPLNMPTEYELPSSGAESINSLGNTPPFILGPNEILNDQP